MTLNLISQFHSVRQNRDARAADHADREARLDRYEERLAERERAVSRREKIQEQKETAAPSAPAASLLRDRGATTDAAALAAEIIRCGEVRRGERADDTPPPTGLAAQILRAGALARGEVVEEDHAPRTQAEITAAAIIEAGRKRRGEV
jgi:hypothetical protein